MSRPYLSIIIPAYNEANRLPETLATVQRWVQRQSFSIEVLIVNDGSSDQTAAVAQSHVASFPELRVISYAPNRGKGGAVRVGMLEAAGEWHLFMDADSSTPVEEAGKLLAYTDHYEVIIGSRYLDHASIKIKQPLKRRIISRFGNLAIRAMVLPGIRDTQCGFKLFSAAASKDIFTLQQEAGWLFDVELLTIAREHGYAIKEVAVDWYDSRQSKLRALHTASNSLRELVEIRQRVRQGRYRSRS